MFALTICDIDLESRYNKVYSAVLAFDLPLFGHITSNQEVMFSPLSVCLFVSRIMQDTSVIVPIEFECIYYTVCCFEQTILPIEGNVI